MMVEGENAKHYTVIDLSSFLSLPGTLVACDDIIGSATMRDRTGELRQFEFGPRRIKIIRKYP